MLIIFNICDMHGDNLDSLVINRSDFCVYLSNIRDNVISNSIQQLRLRNLKVNIFNTETKELSGNKTLYELSKSKEYILGFIGLASDIILYKITQELWDLLCISDGILDTDCCLSPSRYLNIYCKSIIYDKFPYHIGQSDNKKIIIFESKKYLKPVNQEFVFWSGNGFISSLFDIYKLAFIAPTGVDINTEVYYHLDLDNTMYKLDTSQKVIRYMTKLKTLKR